MVLVPILGEAFLDMMKGGFAPSESGISMLALEMCIRDSKDLFIPSRKAKVDSTQLNLRQRMRTILKEGKG